ncbi:MAG: HAMP domain-containing methyl-accepting chemotaxis protein [Beijerinckiaceae bacterium]|nr:HAMP domain-containing methyl-accepting chemotaxis protein [Beijerinckiaceae bacterium]
MTATTIRGKIGIILFLLSLTLLATCATVIVIGNSQRDQLKTAKSQTTSLVNNLIPLLVAVRDMQVDVVQVQQYLTDASATHNAESFNDAAKYYKDFSVQEALVRSLLSRIDAPQDRQRIAHMVGALDELDGRFKTFDEQGIAMAHVYIDKGTEAGNVIMAKFDPMSDESFHRLDAFVADIRGFIDEHMKLGSAAVEKASGQSDSLSLFITIWAVFGMAVVVGAYVVVGRGVTAPILVVTRTMERLAAHDFGVDVQGTDRRDEIGLMARALQVFKDNGLRLQVSEADSAAHRRAAAQERAVNEAASQEAARQQEVVVSSLANGLDSLAKGDLTNRLNQQFPAEYEKIRADFNATANSLQIAIRSISAATAGINTGSDQIANASGDLARRTESQAASVEETTSALDGITRTVEAMAANAGVAADVITTARGAAESSGAIVQQAVDAMSKIKDSSNQIGNIIGVIDEIAFQTNLLALNAGVEAARAGDAGRGFAVVASEVRALAQRSAEAAKEIKALISTSTKEVESGVVLVDKTGAALKEIIAKVAEMDGLVRKISESAREQKTGIAEINTSVAQLDEVVQQNAAIAEESNAAANLLRDETKELAGLVSKFRFGDTERSHVPAPENPVRAAQAKLARAVVRPALKSVASANVKPDKDWEEF